MKAGISFTIEGDAVPKQSYRHSAKGGYTEPRVKDWQEQVRFSAVRAIQGNLAFEPFFNDELLHVTISFQLTHRRRVDVDNLSKAVLDGCNDIIWKDDRQVVELHLAKKHGAQVGRVDVSVFPMLDCDPAEAEFPCQDYLGGDECTH